MLNNVCLVIYIYIYIYISEMVYVLIESIVLGPEPETWAWLSNHILDLRSHPSEKDNRDDSVGMWAATPLGPKG